MAAITLVELLVGLVFVVAGAMKFMRPATLRAALSAVRLPSTATLVRIIAGIEVAVGSALVAGVELRLTTTIALAAVVLFHVVAQRMRAVGYDGGCGCFGSSGALAEAFAAKSRPVFAMLLTVAVIGRTISEGAAVPRNPLVGLTAAAACFVVVVGLVAARDWRLRAQWTNDFHKR